MRKANDWMLLNTRFERTRKKRQPPNTRCYPEIFWRNFGKSQGTVASTVGVPTEIRIGYPSNYKSEGGSLQVGCMLIQSTQYVRIRMLIPTKWIFSLMQWFDGVRAAYRELDSLVA
jgi:hypothetical protein